MQQYSFFILSTILPSQMLMTLQNSSHLQFEDIISISSSVFFSTGFIGTNFSSSVKGGVFLSILPNNNSRNCKSQLRLTISSITGVYLLACLSQDLPRAHHSCLLFPLKEENHLWHLLRLKLIWLLLSSIHPPSPRYWLNRMLLIRYFILER